MKPCSMSSLFICFLFNFLVKSITYVKKHDIYIKPKSYKLELLGELVVKHGIRV